MALSDHNKIYKLGHRQGSIERISVNNKILLLSTDGTWLTYSYRIDMKLCYLIIVLSLLFPANIFAHELPDLGDVSQATISPFEENKLDGALCVIFELIQPILTTLRSAATSTA